MPFPEGSQTEQVIWLKNGGWRLLAAAVEPECEGSGWGTTSSGLLTQQCWSSILQRASHVKYNTNVELGSGGGMEREGRQASSIHSSWTAAIPSCCTQLPIHVMVPDVSVSHLRYACSAAASLAALPALQHLRNPF